ncbi:hypothetical protein SAMN04488028_11515 [Reichenbachiella agariperforans]|uniref:Uncharacterized protein n=1 Tax=Reichenbachiella agariperforans TaxID=156994 RepID=A0A1M6WUR7_REIAG|nr:hypothetical protein BGP76_11615 [Reichenbachiella sp. MSK19-1]SHK97520.1 hypothetical protein SAMN04488028_11515 [Reichenbachiella agariperforans]
MIGSFFVQIRNGYIFEAQLKHYRVMAMLGLIIVLFVAAIVCAFVLPNEKVSNHEKDWDV